MGRDGHGAGRVWDETGMGHIRKCIGSGVSTYVFV